MRRRVAFLRTNVLDFLSLLLIWIGHARWHTGHEICNNLRDEFCGRVTSPYNSEGNMNAAIVGASVETADSVFVCQNRWGVPWLCNISRWLSVILSSTGNVVAMEGMCPGGGGGTVLSGIFGAARRGVAVRAEKTARCEFNELSYTPNIICKME
jgi:hypothetical protein